MINVCILGASGSIGKQTLDVIKKNPNDFRVVGFSVGSRTRCISAILKNNPSVKCIYIKDTKTAKKYQKALQNIVVFSEKDGFEKLITACNPDMVVNALVGFVGLKPSLVTLEQNRILALANKESLVVGGELINDLLSQGKGKLFPIDSEHAAISKCLQVDSNNVERIILTASGGAFRDLTREQLKNVTPEDALKHPTWKMGPKITIDCATMVNKAFEVIEAHYLFHFPSEKIGVVLHKESYVHSMVQYTNGTYRLDVGKPDMRVPIKYALYQTLTPFKTVLVDDYKKIKNKHFSELFATRYPIYKWGEFVIKHKGTYGAVLNASSEVAVNSFLKKEIPFLMIEDIVEHFMKAHKSIAHPTYEQLKDVDQRVREDVKRYIAQQKGAN